MKDLSVKIPSVKQKLEAELIQTPKVSEIAQRLDVTEEDVLQAMESGRAYSAYSLQQSMDEEESEGGEYFIERYTGEEDCRFSDHGKCRFHRKDNAEIHSGEKEFCNMRFVEGKTQQQIAGELRVPR